MADLNRRVDTATKGRQPVSKQIVLAKLGLLNFMESPYRDLPPGAFWRSGVADRKPSDFADFYRPKFPINGRMKIATAGSCFAQHVGRALRQSGFNVIDAERAPALVPDAVKQRYGFGLYSARYGNIYTIRQLLQLWREATGRADPAVPVWQRDDRFFDAQRPGLEPNGFDSASDVLAHRSLHLAAVRKAFLLADVIVFTFGLTETWLHTDSGTVYPTCPGTIAGEYDPKIYSFHNCSYKEIYKNFGRFRDLMMDNNPAVKFIVTVSPVPLTATASGHHVEVATSYSKAVLRAVCGQLVGEFDNVDYFPSYEIITSQKNAARFYSDSLRVVTAEGVAAAMGAFMAAHAMQHQSPVPFDSPVPVVSDNQRIPDDPDFGIVCEEALLEVFRK